MMFQKQYGGYMVPTPDDARILPQLSVMTALMYHVNCSTERPYLNNFSWRFRLLLLLIKNHCHVTVLFCRLRFSEYRTQSDYHISDLQE